VCGKEEGHGGFYFVFPGIVLKNKNYLVTSPLEVLFLVCFVGFVWILTFLCREEWDWIGFR
jgi:hypothetical protein